MKYKPKKPYDMVYIHASKILTKEGWVLAVHSMDAYSQFVFDPVFNTTPQVTLEVLNQLFDNIFKNHNPIIHSKYTVFVSNLPEEYNQLIQQTKAANHKLTYNKDATAKAMKDFFNHSRLEFVDLF